MRRITLLGGEHQTMMAADMIRRLVESSAERCDRTTERQHAIESGHGLPPLPPANSSLSEPPMNNSAGYGSTPGTNPYAAPVTRYNPGDPYGQMPGAQQHAGGCVPVAVHEPRLGPGRGFPRGGGGDCFHPASQSRFDHRPRRREHPVFAAADQGAHTDPERARHVPGAAGADGVLARRA